MKVFGEAINSVNDKIKNKIALVTLGIRRKECETYSFVNISELDLNKVWVTTEQSISV